MGKGDLYKVVILGVLFLILATLTSGCVETAEMPEGYEYEVRSPVGLIISIMLLLVWVFISVIIGFYVTIKMFGLKWSWSKFVASTFLGGLVGGVSGSAASIFGRNVGKAVGQVAGFLATVELISRMWKIPRSKAIMIKIVSGVISIGLILLGFFVLFIWLLIPF